MSEIGNYSTDFVADEIVTNRAILDAKTFTSEIRIIMFGSDCP
jgi:hypothetical protein